MNPNEDKTENKEIIEDSIYQTDIQDMLDESTPPSKLRKLFHKAGGGGGRLGPPPHPPPVRPKTGRGPVS